MKVILKTLPLTLVCIFAASATPPAIAQPQYGSQDSKPCNTIGVTVAGALIGALLGGRHHRGSGAAIGGAVAAVACVAVNYKSRQIKSGQQVSQDYRNANGGNLPPHATLLQYQSQISPSNQVQVGQSSSLDSYIEVAPGADGLRPVIEEEIALISPDGKQLKDVRKPANQGGSAGAFQTQFTFTLPQGVKEGRYVFNTALYINGQNVQSSQLPLQVVSTNS